jgi:hypothetical protein
MRIATAVILILIACAAALLAWGALRNLFAGYRDSPVSTYLLVGLPWLLLAVVAFAAALQLLRR